MAAGEEVAVVGLKAGERSIEHFPPGNDHDVEPLCDLIPPEHLTRQTFHSVPEHGTTELSRRRDAESAQRAGIRNDENRHVLAMEPYPGVVGVLKLRASPDTARS
jgi:hypothetical protein